MPTKDLQPGDLIMAFGQTISQEGLVEKHRMLCTVVKAGKHDIFAEEKGTISNRVFKISASRCIKIDEAQLGEMRDTIDPKPGDLVYYAIDKYSGREEKAGILTEIVDAPGREKRGRVLVGDDLEMLLMDNLITLE